MARQTSEVATVVLDANRYLKAIAVLPISDSDERIVENLIRQRVGIREGTPLKYG